MDGRQRAARAVAARRGELEMTQQQLAAAAGVDVKTIGSLERRGRWPIARTRARIERALRWEPGELERIASGDSGQPVIPPGLLDMIRRTLPPGDQGRVIAAIERTLAGGEPSRPGETGPSSGERLAG